MRLQAKLEQKSGALVFFLAFFIWALMFIDILNLNLALLGPLATRNIILVISSYPPTSTCFFVIDVLVETLLHGCEVNGELYGCGFLGFFD